MYYYIPTRRLRLEPGLDHVDTTTRASPRLDIIAHHTLDSSSSLVLIRPSTCLTISPVSFSIWSSKDLISSSPTPSSFPMDFRRPGGRSEWPLPSSPSLRPPSRVPSSGPRSGGDVEAYRVSVVAGGEPEIGHHERALDVVDGALVEGLDQDGLRVGGGGVGDRLQRRHRTVVLHLDAIEDRRVRAARAHGVEVGADRVDGFLHALLHVQHHLVGVNLLAVRAHHERALRAGATHRSRRWGRARKALRTAGVNVRACMMLCAAPEVFQDALSRVPDTSESVGFGVRGSPLKSAVTFGPREFSVFKCGGRRDSPTRAPSIDTDRFLHRRFHTRDAIRYETNRVCLTAPTLPRGTSP